MCTTKRKNDIIGYNLQLNTIRLLFILVLVSASILSVLPNEQQIIAQIATGFSTYASSGMKIDYPSNWTRQEHVSTENIVAFRDPSSNSSSFRSVGVFTQDLSSLLGLQNVSLDTYSSLRIKYLQDKVGIIRLENSTLSGEPAYRTLYTFDISGDNNLSTGMGLQTWTVQDNKAYLIMFIFSRPDTPQQIAGTPHLIDKMINSFQITSG